LGIALSGGQRGPIWHRSGVYCASSGIFDAGFGAMVLVATGMLVVNLLMMPAAVAGVAVF